MVCGIYLIENKITHQLYVGQSVDIKERWRHHRDNPNDGSYIDSAIQKYGPNNFTLKVITELPKNQKVLDQHEKHWIHFYDTFKNRNHYNLTVGGAGFGSGEDHPSFKGYYRLRKGQFHSNGKQDYKLVNREGDVIIHSVDKDKLLNYIECLENGEITEEEIVKKEFRIVKHGFVNGKQRYVLKDPDGKNLKHSFYKEKLLELKRQFYD